MIRHPFANSVLVLYEEVKMKWPLIFFCSILVLTPHVAAFILYWITK